MSASLPPVEVPSSKWINLNEKTGIAVGTQLVIQNLTIHSVVISQSSTKPDIQFKTIGCNIVNYNKTVTTNFNPDTVWAYAVVGTELQVEDYVNGSYCMPSGSASSNSGSSPLGMITMYKGHMNVFPLITNGETWALCDGDNGTPDLRGQFIRGWSDADDQEHDGSSPRIYDYQADDLKEHRHEITRDREGSTGTGATIAVSEGQRSLYDAFTENTGGKETRPKNYALAFIMKIA